MYEAILSTAGADLIEPFKDIILPRRAQIIKMTAGTIDAYSDQRIHCGKFRLRETKVKVTEAIACVDRLGKLFESS